MILISKVQHFVHWETTPEWRTVLKIPVSPQRGFYRIHLFFFSSLLFFQSTSKASTRNTVCFHEHQAQSGKKTPSIVRVCSRGPCTLLEEVDMGEIMVKTCLSWMCILSPESYRLFGCFGQLWWIIHLFRKLSLKNECSLHNLDKQIFNCSGENVPKFLYKNTSSCFDRLRWNDLLVL